MASINMNSGKREKKGKPQKQTLRVDFTPMVDMNMLLITFFMFCTTLAKPQIMDIAMPATKTEDVKGSLIPESKTLTVLLGNDGIIYHYTGKPNYADYASLIETDIPGLRATLIERNKKSVDEIRELRLQHKQNKISEAEYQSRMSAVKKENEDIFVLIKPTKDSHYKDLVDALDEMQICGVGRYSILDIEEWDEYVIENYKTKGQLAAERMPG